MNNLDTKYQELIKKILIFGVPREDRTGVGTLSTFGYILEHDMLSGFPLLTTKKVLFDKVKSELFWFLEGSTDIRDLWKYDNHIWDDDLYKSYRRFTEKGKYDTYYSKEEFISKLQAEPDSTFAREWSDLGPIYGHQWRSWKGVDQIHQAIEMLKKDPFSRRIIVNAWNVEDLDQMALPPCHFGFQLFVDSINKKDKSTYRLSLMWWQRSADVFLGLPFNLASYGLLLHMFAEEVNMSPHRLVVSIGDAHLYRNHVDQALLQWGREPKQLPTLVGVDGLYNRDYDSIQVVNYDPHPYIKAPLNT